MLLLSPCADFAMVYATDVPQLAKNDVRRMRHALVCPRQQQQPMKQKQQLRSLAPFLTLSIAVSCLAGCGRDEATVTVVPKQSSTSVPTGALPPGHPEPGATMPAGMDMGMGMMHRPKLAFTTPAGWSEAPLGSMRVASFKIEKDGKQADVSVMPLGGGAGGDVANVNRWRGQVSLEPLAEDALKKTAEKVEVAGEPAELYDIAGTNPGSGDPMRVIGVIQHRDGSAWFYKMSGDDALVASQKPALLEFMKSVRFEAAPSAGMLPPSHPPIDGMGAAAAVASAGPISREGQPQWTVPADWKEVAGGQFLVGKFIITGSGTAQAAVNVSASAGEGGGFAANVNRWRRQIGLAEAAEADIRQQSTQMDLAEGKGTAIEISGTDPASGQPTRVIGIMVPRPGQTFFYKLAGEANLVSAQRDNFIKFVQSAKHQ